MTLLGTFSRTIFVVVFSIALSGCLPGDRGWEIRVRNLSDRNLVLSLVIDPATPETGDLGSTYWVSRDSAGAVESQMGSARAILVRVFAEDCSEIGEVTIPNPNTELVTVSTDLTIAATHDAGVTAVRGTAPRRSDGACKSNPSPS